MWKSDHAVGTNWMLAGFSPENIAFGPDGMTLSIRRKETHGKPHSGAEAQLKGYYGYGNYQAVIRAPRGSGLVGAFFTYTGPPYGDPHDEIDFEFLGKNTRQVQLNYFHKGKSMSGVYIDLPFDAADDFHLYEFSWSADMIIWSVDGREVHRVSGPAANVPSASGIVMSSLWAAPIKGWVGPVTYEDGASMTIRCISHRPADSRARQCSDSVPRPSPSRALRKRG